MSPNGTSSQFALRLLPERSGHRAPAESRIIIVPARAIATSIDRINNDSGLPLGNTLRTDVQSAQRLDQAKFQMKAVATKRIIFWYKIGKGSTAISLRRSRRRSRWSMVGGAVVRGRRPDNERRPSGGEEVVCTRVFLSARPGRVSLPLVEISRRQAVRVTDRGIKYFGLRGQGAYPMLIGLYSGSRCASRA